MDEREDKSAQIKCNTCGEVCYTLGPGETIPHGRGGVDGLVTPRRATCSCGIRNIMVRTPETPGYTGTGARK